MLLLPESCRAITTGNFLFAYDVPVVSGVKYSTVLFAPDVCCCHVCEKFLEPDTKVAPVTMFVCDRPVLYSSPGTALLFVSALKMLNAKLLKFKFMEYVFPLSTVIVGLVPATAVPSFFQVKAPAVSSTLKSGTTAGAGGVYVFVIVRTVTLPAVSTVKPVL